MKKILTFICVLFCLITFSQVNGEKTDKIITRDYEIIECIVSKISNTTIEYSLIGEKLVNSIETNKVAKIEFANGKTQVFSVEKHEANSEQKNSEKEANNSNRDVSTAVLKINTIAVLPIPFINSETLASSSEMAKFAQNDVYDKLIDKSANIFPLVVQDLRETNSLLHKAGIDFSNIDEIPIDDLQKILGVDHIVASKVSYLMTVNQTNFNNGTTTVKKKSDDKVKVDDFSMSTSTESKKFDYTVYFDIYKSGTKIYTESRKPFLSSKDSWMDSMSYLLKRSPIYTKK